MDGGGAPPPQEAVLIDLTEEEQRKIAEYMAKLVTEGYYTQFGISDVIGQVVQTLSSIVSKIASSIVNGITGAFKTIESAITGAINTISNIANTIGNIASQVYNVATELFNNIVNFIVNELPKMMYNALMGFRDFIVSKFEELLQWLGIIRSDTEEVKAGVSQIQNGVSNLSDDVSTLLGKTNDVLIHIDQNSSILMDTKHMVEVYLPNTYTETLYIKGALEDVKTGVLNLPDKIEEKIFGSDEWSKLVYSLAWVQEYLKSAKQLLVEMGANLEWLMSYIKGMGEDLEKVYMYADQNHDIIVNLNDKFEVYASKSQESLMQITNGIDILKDNIVDVSQHLQETGKMAEQILMKSDAILTKVDSNHDLLVNLRYGFEEYMPDIPVIKQTVIDTSSLVQNVSDQIQNLFMDVNELKQAYLPYFQQLINLANQNYDVMKETYVLVNGIWQSLSSIETEIAEQVAEQKAIEEELEELSNKSDTMIGYLDKNHLILVNLKYGFEEIVPDIGAIRTTIESNVLPTLTTVNTNVENTLYNTEEIKSYAERNANILMNDLYPIAMNNHNILVNMKYGFEEYLPQIPQIRDILDTQIRTGILNLDSKLEKAIYDIGEIKYATNKYANMILNDLRANGELLHKIDEGIKGLGEKISELDKDLVVKIGQIIDKVSQELHGDINTISTQLGHVTQAVDETKNTVQSQQSLLQDIENAVNDLKNMILGGINDLVNEISNIGQYIWNALPDYIQQFFQNFNTVLNELSSFVKDPVGTLTNLLNQIVTPIANFLVTLGQDIMNAFGQALVAIEDALAGFFGNLASIAGKVLGFIEQVVYDILKTLASMLMNAMGFVLNAISDAIGTVANVIFSAFSKIFTTSLTTVTGGGWQGAWNMVATLSPVYTTINIATRAFEEIANLASSPPSTVNVLRSILGFEFDPFGSAVTVALDITKRLMIYLSPLILGEAILGAFGEQVLDWLVGLLVDVKYLPPKVTENLKARLKVRMKDFISPIATFIKNSVIQAVTGVVYGTTFWLMEPLRYFYRLQFIENSGDMVTNLMSKYAGTYLNYLVEHGFGVPVMAEVPTEGAVKRFVHAYIAYNIYNTYLRRGVEPSTDMVLSSIYSQMMGNFAALIYKLKGWPRQILDFIKDMGITYSITIMDRFGRSRTIPLTPMWELMTHSELVRMTQKDVLPDIKTMLTVGLVRGVTPDLMKMLYLLSFKYPSFEKLWKFFMRATAGMLWYRAPAVAKELFENEAARLGAGSPVDPYTLQTWLSTKGATAMDGFKTAINTYLKWIEYSNFSWFTPETKINDVPVGAHIYGTLGGWTADSWLLFDVAADIPTKIDMRWMSRYGIFLWMAEKIGFDYSYRPLVDVVTKLMDTSASSSIKVDLRWFSKLLQATGLHPAWVPITTVAENIMVISDEMTLLRTGWMNLYRYGFTDPDLVTKALSGLFTVSYNVAYWNPETNEWTSGWINLPVRWLPHEIKLLEIRMAIDRVVELYRDLRNLIRSAVRYKAIKLDCDLRSTVDTVLTKGPIENPSSLCDYMANMYYYLRNMFKEDMKRIVGQEIELPIDDLYLEYFKDIVGLEGDIAINIEKKLWFFRLSGWLLYYGARGYITPEDLDAIIQKVRDAFALSDAEVQAYEQLANSLSGVIIRTLVPTPNEVATIAEVWPDILTYQVTYTTPSGKQETLNFLDYVLTVRHIPDVVAKVWREYVRRRPYRDDIASVMNSLVTATEHGPILIDIWSSLWNELSPVLGYYGYDSNERTMRMYAGLLRMMYYEYNRYIPTPRGLATLIELVPEILDENFSSYEEAIELPVLTVDENGNVRIENKKITVIGDIFYDALNTMILPSKWKQVWELYLKRAPYRNEVERLVSAVLTAGSVLPWTSIVDYILGFASDYGYDSLEQSMLKAVSYIRRIERSWTLSFNTPSELARLVELVPEALTTQYAYTYTITIGNNTYTIDVKSSVLEDVVNSLELPNAYKKLITAYIYRREVSSEVNRYITQLLTAHRYMILDSDALTKAFGALAGAGVSDNEAKALFATAELRRAEREWSLLGATVHELAQIAELVPWVLTSVVNLTYKVPQLVVKANEDGTIDVSVSDMVQSFTGTFFDFWLRPKYVPDAWVDVIRDYVYLRTIRDEVRRAVTAVITAYEYVGRFEDWLVPILGQFTRVGYDSNEVELLKFAAMLRRFDREWRIVAPSVNELAVIAEYVPEVLSTASITIDVPYLTIEKSGPGQYKVVATTKKISTTSDWLTFWLGLQGMPPAWVDILKKYVQRRPLREELRYLARTLYQAVRYGVSSELLTQAETILKEYGFTDTELSILKLAGEVYAQADVFRYLRSHQASDSIPRATFLANIAEYVPVPDTIVEKAFSREVIELLGLEDYVELVKEYIRVRPLKPEARRLLRALIQALAYGIVTSADVEGFVAQLGNYGFTSEEIELVTRWAKLEEEVAEARYLRREYMPTPRSLASIAEVMTIPEELILDVFKRYNVPQEWQSLWLQYIKVRPLYNDVNALATAYFRAKAYGVNLGDLENTILNIMKQYGWTDEEIYIRNLRAQVEELIRASREYIPTPAQLAVIAEVVPAARNLIDEVFAYRNVPQEWQDIWRQYVNLRPLQNEVSRLISSALTLYEDYLITKDMLESILDSLKPLGLEDAEIQLLITASTLRRHHHIYREVIGTPRSLVAMAEYSPTARDVVTAMIHGMIDELPIDDNTKQLLKAMWDEYIRVRPVYDEVRAYVRELVNDYAVGVIDYETLYNELQNLKQWGLDDYEIQFWLWLAEKRRVRYAVIYGYGY